MLATLKYNEGGSLACHAEVRRRRATHLPRRSLAKAGHFLILTSSFFLSFVSSSPALVANGTITWGAPTNISGDSNVSTDGSLVAAFNMNGATATVNGVTFNSFMFTSNTTSATSGNFTFSETSHILVAAGLGSGSAPFSSLSSSYQSLLNTALTTDENNTLTLAMSGLTTGQQYEFQFFLNGSNTAGADNLRTIASATNSVTLDDNTTNAVGGTGQSVIGTFTAAGPQELITFNGVDSTQAPTVNAFQLRNLSVVPEPTTLALLGIGAIGAAVRRRRK
jgi:PEP-CTERM motif